jgi:hypothetical protein
MRPALRSISAAGCLLFLGLSVATLAGPRFFERRAKQYLVERLGAEVEQRYHGLRVLDTLCKHDCGLRAGQTWGAVRAWLPNGLELAWMRVRDRVQARFDTMIDRLLRDVRIFAGTNALMFLLAFLAASSDPAPRALTVISGALIASATLGTALYLFAQNWLTTLLFGDYLGWGYLVFVVVIVAAELDLLLNRGRLLAALGEGIGWAGLGLGSG